MISVSSFAHLFLLVPFGFRNLSKLRQDHSRKMAIKSLVAAYEMLEYEDESFQKWEQTSKMVKRMKFNYLSLLICCCILTCELYA